MKKKLFLLLFITLPFISHTQDIGYKNKRFFIEIGATLFPNISTPTFNNKGPRTFPHGVYREKFTIADRYNLSLNYVLSKKHSLNLSYDLSLFGQDVQARTLSLLDPDFIDRYNIFFRLFVHDISCHIAISPPNERNISPKGFYWKFGLRFLFIKGEQHLYKVQYYNRPSLDETYRPEILNPLEINHFTFMIGLSGRWGYRFVLTDRILLNLGLELNLFPQAFVAMANPLTQQGAPSNNEVYQSDTMQNVASRYTFGIHISIGALIF